MSDQPKEPTGEQPKLTSADHVRRYRKEYIRDKYRKHCAEQDKAKHGDDQPTTADADNS